MARAHVFRQAFLWTTMALVGMVCLSYLIDFAILRWRFNTKHDPTQVVVIKPYYAVPRKDHKIEYMPDDPKEETCVNSLFPHAGAGPCWYLTRHTDRRIDISRSSPEQYRGFSFSTSFSPDSSRSPHIDPL